MSVGGQDAVSLSVESSEECAQHKGKHSGSRLQTKLYECAVGQLTIYIQLVKLKQSCFLWIGDQRKCLDNLTVALPNPFEAPPLASSILDRRPADSIGMNDESRRLAMKLSKKLGAQVFVSYTVDSPPEVDVISVVEKFLFDALRSGDTFTL
ncbi:uncharacterized protein LOC129581667 [Paramacrobiotus metropolitanus]|uniref:uncharacterized protein LOC129581667 n=1 Tax=Paramacrobiotus metropolitanus TaxID=2943436 RepID=UPI002446262F|nr:uncharacterized protein LOC129581667 [Paramacrobiotus metropolitanus]